MKQQRDFGHFDARHSDAWLPEPLGEKGRTTLILLGRHSPLSLLWSVDHTHPHTHTLHHRDPEVNMDRHLNHTEDEDRHQSPTHSTTAAPVDTPQTAV